MAAPLLPVPLSSLMARRVTRTICLKAAENIVLAAGFADQLGLPLNRFVTVLWEGGQSIGTIQTRQGLFIERMSKWLRYRNVSPAYLWVIENGPAKGLHSHILIHVPSKHLKAFKRKAPTWVDGPIDKSTVDIRRTRYGHGLNRWNGLKGRLRYILKGGDKAVSSLMRINLKHQGTVVGKRSGTSQNIGVKARQLKERWAANEISF